MKRIAELAAEVERLRGVVREVRGELEEEEIKYTPNWWTAEQNAEWRRQWDAETERLVEGG